MGLPTNLPTLEPTLIPSACMNSQEPVLHSVLEHKKRWAGFLNFPFFHYLGFLALQGRFLNLDRPDYFGRIQIVLVRSKLLDFSGLIFIIWTCPI